MKWTYRPIGGAKELWHCRAPRVLIEGPAGTGKTTAAMFKIYGCTQQFPGIRVLVTRDTRASLTQSVLNTLEKNVLGATHPVLLDGPSPDSRRVYNFANGSQIVLAGLDKPSRTFSAEYDIVYVGEAIETVREQVELLLRTLRNGKMPFQQLICDTNPGDPSHWLNEAANEGWFHRIKTTHRENPYLWNDDKKSWTAVGGPYMENLGAMTGPRRARMLLGKWTQAEGVIYTLFDRKKHMRADPGPWKRTIICVDDGTTAEFAALRVRVGENGRRHVDAMAYLPGLVEHPKVEAVANLARGCGRVDVVVDSAAASLIEALRQHGITTHGADKTDRNGGIDQVHDLLRERADGEPGLTLDPTCTALANEFSTYCWKKTTDGRITDTPIDHHNHALDALRYGVRFLANSAASAADGDLIDAMRRAVVAVGPSRQTFGFAPVKGWGVETDRLLSKRDRSAYRIGEGQWRYWGTVDDEGRPPNHPYVLAVAAGLGIPGDHTYACIADADTRQVVADVVFERVPPDTAARLCIIAAMEFRNALMIVKSSGAGAAFLSTVNRLGYGPMYRMTTDQAVNDKIGWNWSPPGSLALLAEYRDAVVNGRFVDPAPEAADALSGWIVHPDGYAAPASVAVERSARDAAASVSDRAIASMLACHGLKQVPPTALLSRKPRRYSPEWCDMIAKEA